MSQWVKDVLFLLVGFGTFRAVCAVARGVWSRISRRD